jgi:tRNA (Thr-GGU) A37 N-methylase
VTRSEHIIADQTPIQPAYANGCKGRSEIFPGSAEGLRDLETFSHIYLISHSHRTEPARLVVKPFFRSVERGVFATRAACGPNGIGLTIMELVCHDRNALHLDNGDNLNGTHRLDIESYEAKFDRVDTTGNTWQDEVDEKKARQNGRRSYIGS